MGNKSKKKKKKDYLSFIVRVAKSTALIRGDTKQVIFFLRSEVLKHNNRHVMKIWGKPWYLSVVLWCKI